MTKKVCIELSENVFYNISKASKELSAKFNTCITIEQLLIDELTIMFK